MLPAWCTDKTKRNDDMNVHVDPDLAVRKRHLPFETVALVLQGAPAFAHGSMAETQRRERMDIKRNGSRPSTKAPEAYFSGAVRVEPVFQVGEDRSRLVAYQTRIAEIDSAVRSLKVARPFEVDLQRLRIHLRMVQEDVSRMGAAN
jgi:hypothetical protein